MSLTRIGAPDFTDEGAIAFNECGGPTGENFHGAVSHRLMGHTHTHTHERTHTHRHTHRHRHTHTHRHTHSLTDTHSHSHTDTHTKLYTHKKVQTWIHFQFQLTPRGTVIHREFDPQMLRSALCWDQDIAGDSSKNAILFRLELKERILLVGPDQLRVPWATEGGSRLKIFLQKIARFIIDIQHLKLPGETPDIHKVHPP